MIAQKPQAMQTGVAIVGAGHAGVECAFALRAAGYAGNITLLSEEHHLPYQRPPLSKGYLAGETSLERIALRGAENYQKQNIQLLLGFRVTQLDTEAKCLTSQDGQQLIYEFCVLAPGARARALPGVEGPHLHSIRTVDDAQALQHMLEPGKRILVVGGGYLGLEVASTAAKKGAQVTVLEQAQVLMSGRVSGHTAQAFEDLHRAAGITLVGGGVIRECVYENGGWQVQLDNGARFEADAVLVSIGAVPCVEFVLDAGIACDNGILVDEACRTSAAGVYAIGDCASSHRPALQARARIESVQNAMEQARIAAASIAGQPLPELRPNTFWSEQQGKRLQMAGLARPGIPCDEYVHTTQNGWVVERYQGGRLAVIEAVDSPVEFIKGTKRLGEPLQSDSPLHTSSE